MLAEKKGTVTLATELVTSVYLLHHQNVLWFIQQKYLYFFTWLFTCVAMNSDDYI